MRPNLDLLAKVLFFMSIAGVVWGYGVLSHKYDLFPYHQLQKAITESVNIVSSTVASDRKPWWYFYTTRKDLVKLHNHTAVSGSLILVSGIDANNELMAKVIDNDGNQIHSWEIDWFKLWPNPNHLPEDLRPREKPGEHIHGIVLMPNGDLAFNFEGLGLIRLGFCGNVVWRLPYRTHHSLHLDENGHLWTGGQILHEKVLPRLLNHKPPFEEFTIVEISPEGTIVSEVSVANLLIKNGLKGLLYLSTLSNGDTVVTGNTLHLNDVEPFPSSLHEGIFERGDIMISLRNINAILVYNKETHEIRFLSVGRVLRQHDPDFVDGNTISVFDNNNLLPSSNIHSKIVTIDAAAGSVTELFAGSKQKPLFFTNIMGKHQLLPNGNVLITISMAGQAVELGPHGEIIWEYNNIVKDGVLGLLDEVQRLPSRFNKAYFERRKKTCPTNLSIKNLNTTVSIHTS